MGLTGLRRDVERTAPPLHKEGRAVVYVGHHGGTRHQLRRRRFHLCQMVEQIRAEPGATPQLRATQQQYCRELELSIMRYMWDEAQEMVQQAIAGAYLVEEHRGRGPPYPQNYRP